MITAQNLQLQRVYSYYKQQMGLVSNLSSKNNILNRLTAPAKSFKSHTSSKISIEKINSVNETNGFASFNGSVNDNNNQTLGAENDVNMECFEEEDEIEKSNENTNNLNKESTEEIPSIAAEIQIEKPKSVEVQMENQSEELKDKPTEDSNEKPNEEVHEKQLEDSDDKSSENSCDKTNENTLKTTENQIDKHSTNLLEKIDSNNSEVKKTIIQTIENLEDVSMSTTESDKKLSESIPTDKSSEIVDNSVKIIE